MPLLPVRTAINRFFGRGETKKPHSPPFDTLTEADFVRLRILISSDEWPTFLKLIDAAAIFYNEQLLLTRDTETLHALRGTVGGIRKAAFLPEEALQLLENIGNQSKLAAAVERDAAERRVRATFSTPAWRD